MKLKIKKVYNLLHRYFDCRTLGKISTDSDVGSERRLPPCYLPLIAQP